MRTNQKIRIIGSNIYISWNFYSLRPLEAKEMDACLTVKFNTSLCFLAVYKRSANVEEGKFVVFSGKGTQELRIINYGDIAEHEVEGPVAMA